MSWLPILLLALASLAGAVFALRLPRQSVALFAAALLFGLAGYATQGSPGLAGKPGTRVAPERDAGEALVDARRTAFDTGQAPSRFIVISDGFARRGQYSDAAQILRGATRDEPENPEAWAALGNALVEHADGRLTPAALEAFERARQTGSGHPGGGYFLGIALLREGRASEARELWAQMLADAPPDAPWKADLEMRLQRLDQLIAVMQAAAE